MGLSVKSKQNLMWLEKCQANYGCLLSQFIDIIKPMIYNYTNSSLEVSVGKMPSKNKLSTLLKAKTNNVFFKIEVVNDEIILLFCDADNPLYIDTMFGVNLSYIKNFGFEKINVTSQNYTFYQVVFTYEDFKYRLTLKVQN